MNSTSDPLSFLAENRCRLCDQQLTDQNMATLSGARLSTFRMRLRGLVLNHLTSQHYDEALANYPVYTQAHRTVPS